MILPLILIGALLIVAGVRGTYRDLFNALGQDVPAFGLWAAAIVAVGAIGFVPGLKPVSRGLLALVITVIVINNYPKILQGFNEAWQNAPEAVPATPAKQPENPANNSGAMNKPSSVFSSGDLSILEIV